MARADNFAIPRSLNDIEVRASAWRYAFGYQDAWIPDIIRILEHDLYEIDGSYTFRVMFQHEMKDCEGISNFAPYEICIREDVYIRATRGDGRARFTCAHELGHYVLHCGESRPRGPRLVTDTIQSTYMSSEWQANTFARCFLLPSHIVRQFSTALEVAECCNVSLQVAEIRVKELGLNKKKRELPEEVLEFLRQKGRR